MADPHYEFGGTDNAAIAADRVRMWHSFTKASQWGICFVIALLLFIYLIWG
ncbi:MAG TPA: preprotein translocase subunit SecE [Roseomonas sp.]|jgi:hypothetical protein